jgi:hypothetical protein
MAWTPQYQQRYQPTQQQMPQQQMPQQQMPQQMPQQQYQNPAANWQQTYQNSQWYRPNPYQQNPYQSQMPQQQQQYQQQQMPQFTQQQINSFLNFMRSRPMPNFMGDPRYQAQQAEKPVYQPPPTPTARTFVPTVRYEGGGRGATAGIGARPTVGDAAADAWVRAKSQEILREKSLRTGQTVRSDPKDIQNLYNQYYAGAA